jgi:hypothetical protein
MVGAILTPVSWAIAPSAGDAGVTAALVLASAHIFSV